MIEEATYVNNCDGFDDLGEKEKGPATSFWTQFSVLTRRSIFITFQEKVYSVFFLSFLC